jgi:hypothetical protein
VSGAASQSFTFLTSPNGFQRIKDTATNLCLAVSSMSTNVGITIVEAGCADVNEQRFRAIPVTGSPGTFQLQANSSGRCLDVQNGSIQNGALMVQGECSDLSAQFVVPQSGACTQVSACAYDRGQCAGGYTCRDTGPNQRACDDINECAVNNGGCGDASKIYCDNFMGGRSCRDRDECYETGGWVCGNPGQTSCSNWYGGYSCNDINECAVNNGGCGNDRQVRCFNDNPGYRCQALNKIYSQTFGGSGGNWFESPDISIGRIRGFDIYASNVVEGITMYYNDDNQVYRSYHVGGWGGSNNQVRFDWDESVTGFFGYYGNMLSEVGFLTSKGRQFGSYGSNTGTYFISNWAGSPYPFWAVGIHGKAGSKIDQFGMFFR